MSSGPVNGRRGRETFFSHPAYDAFMGAAFEVMDLDQVHDPISAVSGAGIETARKRGIEVPRTVTTAFARFALNQVENFQRELEGLTPESFINGDAQ